MNLLSPLRFIEYGEYKGNYYGTSLDSIRAVLSKNKVCLLDVQPHVSDAFQLPQWICAQQTVESQRKRLNE